MQLIPAAILSLVLGVNAVTLSYAQSTEDGVVEFRDRKIDVGAFVNSFPYDPWRWTASLKSNALFFLKLVGDKQLIHRVMLKPAADGAVSFEEGKPVCAVDISTRTIFGPQIREADGHFYFTGDENNNEKFNIYDLDPDSGALRKLTNAEYVPDFAFSEDEQKLAYTERLGVEGSRINVRVLDLITLEDTIIASDSVDQQFTWYDLSWSPKGDSIVLTTLTKGVRTNGNISIVATNGDHNQRPRVLTDAAVPRNFPQVVPHWLSDTKFLYLSNEKGATNLYAMEVDTGTSYPLTAFGSDVSSVKVWNKSTKPYAVFAVSNPISTTVYRLDDFAVAGKATPLFKNGTAIELLSLEHGEVLFQQRSTQELITFLSVDIAKQGALVTRAQLSPDLAGRVVQCDAKAIMYDTFDDVPMRLGEERYQGKIHGFLFTPKNPLPVDQRTLVVQSFYGGENRYERFINILCAAGIHIFSPAPRGAAGISGEFEKLNDGDMGGKEVLDVMYGAKYVSKLLDIAPQRVGVWGHSHGGYEAMWQVTQGNTVANAEQKFPWGFAIAESGFSSIKEEYEFSNIKAWIAKEAGDPAIPANLATWEARSPINHVANLSARVLLIHGTSDKRVPYASSKSFYDKVAAAGKGDLITLVAVKDAGHTYNSKADIMLEISAVLQFLDKL